MRILIVNWLDRENPQAGGAEEHLHEIFGRLAACGHEVTLLASGWPGCAPTTQLDGLDVHRVGGRYTFSLAAPAYFRRKLATRDFDVVVEDLNKVPLFTPYWVSAPVVLVTHHLFGVTAFQAAPLPVAAATWLLERPIPAVYSGVPAIAVSESTKEDLIHRGLRAGDIDIVPNGVGVDTFTPRFDTKTAHPTLLFLGRLKSYKRVDLVIEAVARLAEEGIDAELLVGGKGDQAASLESLASRLGVSDRVRLLGFVPDETKLALLRSSWVHVLTSPKEGWGISVIEAAACGTPSVASNAPGLRESVAHERTGLLVPHGDVETLVDALRDLIRDPERRMRMSHDARSFAEGFSWDTSAERIEALLSRVVAASGRE